MVQTQRRERSDMSSRILDVAERLVQVRGFNGFSYADVASELGVTKASLHYHFPSKADLGAALIARYSARFAIALAAIEEGPAGPHAKLDAYAGLFADVLREDRMCLCGMLAADYHTLPAPMQVAVRSFFDESETWLERVLERGRELGTLEVTGSSSDAARILVSGLEGAMLVARSYGDVARFEVAARRLLAGITGESSPDPGPR